MIVEERLTTVLLNVGGCEFFPGKPTATDLARIGTNGTFGTYSKVGGQGFSNLEESIDLSQPRMQISIFSINFGELLTIEKAVADAMKAANRLYCDAVGTEVNPFDVAGALSNSKAAESVDGYEDDTTYHYRHMDYYCWSNE